MSTDRYQTILLFGPPGVGKGTQGKILHEVPGFFHSSTGDIFRNLDAQSELGKLFFQYSSRGELVPDDVTMRIWHQNVYAQSILQMFKPNADLLVLDGLPRSVNQANVLYRYCNVLAVVHLAVLEMERLLEAQVAALRELTPAFVPVEAESYRRRKEQDAAKAKERVAKFPKQKN
jgi:adenylate kinase